MEPPQSTVLERIEGAVSARSVRGVAGAVAALIRAGELPQGTRLPPVRALAEHLGVSPTTVAAAWSQLASLGLIASRGRSGTFVTESPVRRPRRWYGSLTSPARFDLGTGAPDPRLLPNPLAHLADLGALEPATYADPPVYEPLLDALATVLPHELAALSQAGTTVVGGALEAIGRLLDTLPPSTRLVGVEDPTFPALFDLVEARGYAVAPIPLDREGPDPLTIARYAERPELGGIILQPRAQNPTGASISPARRDAIVAALAHRHDVLVIEDDHSGLVASSPLASVASRHPTSAYVLSFSKSHGPDLRLCAIVTDPARRETLDQVRSLGPSWSSKLLQALLAQMLNDPGAATTILEAREHYRRRREDLAEALGLSIPGDGINAWVEGDETAALAERLARYGVRVIPGASFAFASSGPSAVRITLADPHHDFGDALAHIEAALSAGAPPQRAGFLGR